MATDLEILKELMAWAAEEGMKITAVDVGAIRVAFGEPELELERVPSLKPPPARPASYQEWYANSVEAPPGRPDPNEEFEESE